MCGIVGIYNMQNKKVDKEVLEKMTNSLIHRGPDGEGYFIKGNLGFGHRRLSIIDLSENAKQPMCNEDKSIWIVYNGEVYNYIELMDNLKNKGHYFKSCSDTEVIIHSYEEYGFNCLEKFIGMFSFAIWDERKRILFCARDRFGIKPFYYFFDGEIFIFSSEIKAILESGCITAEPEDEIICDYLVFGLKNHKEKTFFKNIKTLNPAHYLILENSNLKKLKYWELNPTNKIKKDNKNEIEEKFLEIFKESIKIHLRSDVPVGTCLSGGLDSSAIVCLIDNFFNYSNLNTFSAVYEDENISEKKYIDIVLKKINVKGFFIYPKPKNLIDEIEKIIYFQEEPFSSTSIYAQWNVMKLAKENGIKVLLDGQGADEIFAGYHYYYYPFYIDLIRSFKFRKFFKEIKYYFQYHNYSKIDFLSKIFYYSLPFSFRERLNFYFKNKNLNFKYIKKRNNNLFLDSRLDKDLYGNLILKLPALLHYEDRNSMSHSIESRVPFLDHRVVEFLFSLPSKYKIEDGYTKAVLRNSMKNIIPEEIIKRKDKVGFLTPENLWLKNDLKEFVFDILNSKSFKERKFYNSVKIKKEYNYFIAGKIKDTSKIWRVINAELFLRKYFDR